MDKRFAHAWCEAVLCMKAFFVLSGIGGIVYVKTGIAGNLFTSFYNVDMGIVSDGLAFQPEEQGQPVVLHHRFFVEHWCAEGIHLFQRILCRDADTVSGSRIPVG
jgi:hypothetical protein